VPQATSLDDPMFQVAPVGEMAETAAGEVGLMTMLSQRLPTPGKLAARGRVAARDVAMAAAELEAAKLQVAADTRRAYWNHYFATRAIEVTDQSRGLLEQFRDVADSRLRAGQAEQQDVLRASTELSNIDNELVTLRQRQASAAAMLNMMLDRPVTAHVPRPAALTLAALALDLDALLADAARDNPQLEKLREQAARYREQHTLAKLGRIPDLTVSVNYNAVEDEGLSPVANGDDQWWFGLGFNLPIWAGRLDAAEREARRGVLESLAELRAEDNRVAFRVRDALARVEANQQLVKLFAEAIVPQARQTMDASLSSYSAGRADFLTLIDAWRRLLAFQVMEHRALSQFHQDLADLQQAIGRDVQTPGGADADDNETNKPIQPPQPEGQP
jgi:outer membrane protein TolC